MPLLITRGGAFATTIKLGRASPLPSTPILRCPGSGTTPATPVFRSGSLVPLPPSTMPLLITRGGAFAIKTEFVPESNNVTAGRP